MAFNKNVPLATNQVAADLASMNANWEYTAPGVVTTAGDVVYATGSEAITRLAIGTAGQMLLTNAGATAPEWASMSGDATIAAGGAVTLASDLKIKGWINLDGTGVIAADDSYNVSGVTDNGTGDYTVTWDTDFADDNYAVVAFSHQAGPICYLQTIAAGSVEVKTITIGGSAADADPVCVIAIGDQA